MCLFVRLILSAYENYMKLRLFKNETRVIQTPNHVTYVSVGEEGARPLKKLPQGRFPVRNENFSQYVGLIFLYIFFDFLNLAIIIIIF